jgi:hypothetical protein
VSDAGPFGQATGDTTIAVRKRPVASTSGGAAAAVAAGVDVAPLAPAAPVAPVAPAAAPGPAVPGVPGVPRGRGAGAALAGDTLDQDATRLSAVRLPGVPVPAGGPAVTTAGGRRRGGLIGVIVAGLVVCVAIVAAVWALAHHGTPGPKPSPTASVSTSADATPQNPEVDEQAAPTHLQWTRAADGSTTFTWTNPDPQTGDVYAYIDQTQATPAYRQVEGPAVTFPASEPAPCIAVQIVHADGTTSQTSPVVCAEHAS